MSRLVESEAQLIQNIKTFQFELIERHTMADSIGKSRAWCVHFMPEAWRWVFAPAKFIAYENPSASRVANYTDEDGREAVDHIMNTFGYVRVQSKTNFETYSLNDEYASKTKSLKKASEEFGSAIVFSQILAMVNNFLHSNFLTYNSKSYLLMPESMVEEIG